MFIWLQDREKALKAEIDLLREELVSQSRKMADNNQIMQQMQEQLVRIESSRDSRESSTQSSKVCTLSWYLSQTIQQMELVCIQSMNGDKSGLVVFRS